MQSWCKKSVSLSPKDANMIHVLVLICIKSKQYFDWSTRNSYNSTSGTADSTSLCQLIILTFGALWGCVNSVGISANTESEEKAMATNEEKRLSSHKHEQECVEKKLLNLFVLLGTFSIHYKLASITVGPFYYLCVNFCPTCSPNDWNCWQSLRLTRFCHTI